MLQRTPYVASAAVTSGACRTTRNDDEAATVLAHAASIENARSSFVRLMDLNTDGYENSYNSFEVAGQKRLSNRWQLVSSFLGTHVDTWDADTGVPQTPNVANFFPKQSYWEWAFKLSGSYRLPYDIQAAATFTSQSGPVWARDVRYTTGLEQLTEVILFMEDQAARRLPTQNLLNLRFEKRQRIGFGTASFQLDVFNVTNTNVELEVTERSGVNFGRITSIVAPRIARLGVTFRF